MTKLKAEEYLELVRRSDLVDNERLTQVLSELQQPISDSGIVGSTLIKHGLLTEWQNEKLLAGRYKGFFLGKYKILAHLGTGGMSSVYLAEHRLMRHRVAIKVLPKNLVQQSSYLERFHQEARAAALLDHPNMVRAYDVDNDRDTHFLVMEYVEGSDVKELVAENGPLPYRTVADYVRQAADGLSYAHSRGLVHRDVKPANLLVDKSGTVKILDLGLVRFSDEVQGSLTVEYDENMIGTVDYLAPEQAMNSHKADARADIYSLGCTLYFMLTGNPPFPEGTIPQRVMMHQTSEPPSVRKVRSDAPEGLLSICSRMMAKKPENRYQSAADVSQALNSWMAGGSGVLSGSSAIFRRGTTATSGSSGPRTNPPEAMDEDELTLAPLEDEPVGRTPATTRPVAAKKDDQAAAGGSDSAKRKMLAATTDTMTGKPQASPAKPASTPGKPTGPAKPKPAAVKPPSAKPQTPARSQPSPAARPGAAATARPQTAQPAPMDEFEDLLGAPDTGGASTGPDWATGPAYYSSPSISSGSIWRLIAIGVVLGAILLGIFLGVWALLGK